MQLHFIGYLKNMQVIMYYLKISKGRTFRRIILICRRENCILLYFQVFYNRQIIKIMVPPHQHRALILKRCFFKKTPQGLRKLPAKNKHFLPPHSSRPFPPPPFVRRLMYFVCLQWKFGLATVHHLTIIPLCCQVTDLFSSNVLYYYSQN